MSVRVRRQRGGVVVEDTDSGQRETVLEPFVVEGDASAPSVPDEDIVIRPVDAPEAPAPSSPWRNSIIAGRTSPDHPAGEIDTINGPMPAPAVDTPSERDLVIDQSRRVNYEAERPLREARARVRAEGQALGADDTTPIHPVTSFVRGAVRTVPIFGSSMDEILGATSTAGDVITGDTPISDFPTQYERNRDLWRHYYDRAEVENPNAWRLGEGAGIFGQLIGLGSTRLGQGTADFINRGATVGSRLGRGALVAGGMGAAQGFGDSDDPAFSQSTLLRTLGTGAASAALNLPIQAGLEGISAIGRRIAPASARQLAQDTASTLAEVQEGGGAGDIARRMLDEADEGVALRRAALQGERDMDDLAQRGAGAMDRLLQGSEEALGGQTHDTLKRRALTRAFSQEPANPDAINRSMEALVNTANELQEYTGDYYAGALRQRSREAIRQIGALAEELNATDISTPEGQAAAYTLMDSAKRSVGRAYASLMRSTGMTRPGVTLPSHSPYRAFERAYGGLQQTLEDPALWGEAASGIQRRINPAWTEFLPHSERLNSLAHTGLERSSSNPFAMESSANGRAWSQIAQNAGRWEDAADRESIRMGARSAANLAQALDETYMGGRASEATAQMRSAAEDMVRILDQMEVQGRARDELRALASVQVRGIRLDSVVRAMAAADEMRRSGNLGVRALGEGATAATTATQSGMAKLANAMQAVRQRFAMPGGGTMQAAHEVADFLAGLLQDPDVHDAASQMQGAPASNDGPTDEDFGIGEMGPDSSALDLEDEDFGLTPSRR